LGGAPAIPAAARETPADLCQREIEAGERTTLSVSDHKAIAKGTLRTLTRAAGLTVEPFAAVVK